MIIGAKQSNLKIQVVTHPTPHHADEVFAVAAIVEAFPKAAISLKRPDRAKLQEHLDDPDTWVIDCGRQYDPSMKNFDHHQPSSDLPRHENVAMASFGLIWKELGRSIVEMACRGMAHEAEIDLDAATDRVRTNLVVGIDAWDVGVRPSAPVKFQTVSTIVSNFNLGYWFKADTKRQMEAFVRAVDFARSQIQIEVENAIHFQIAREETAAAVATAEGGLAELTSRVPWHEHIREVPGGDEVFAFISVRAESTTLWLVTDDQGKAKLKVPQSWRGLADDPLVRETGVPGAKFVHRAGPYIYADSREAAAELYNKLLDFNLPTAE